jgi:hypothetical protein
MKLLTPLLFICAVAYSQPFFGGCWTAYPLITVEYALDQWSTMSNLQVFYDLSVPFQAHFTIQGTFTLYPGGIEPPVTTTGTINMYGLWDTLDDKLCEFSFDPSFALFGNCTSRYQTAVNFDWCANAAGIASYITGLYEYSNTSGSALLLTKKAPFNAQIFLNSQYQNVPLSAPGTVWGYPALTMGTAACQTIPPPTVAPTPAPTPAPTGACCPNACHAANATLCSDNVVLVSYVPMLVWGLAAALLCRIAW